MNKIIVAIILCIIPNIVFSQVKPSDLRCEYRVNPLGIDNVKPRFSWKISNEEKTRGQKQTIFQILVASSEMKLAKNIGDIWDSKTKESNQSVSVIYSGRELSSGQNCYWKVRVWDMNGKVSGWSNVAKFTIGLLKPEEWKGEWILKNDQSTSDHNWYRKNFELNKTPESAMVYVASFGYHELYVNGKKVDDQVMTPVLTYMKARIPYVTYDIAKFLTKGDNVIAIWHAGGWARWNRISEYRMPPFVFKAQAEIQTKGDKITISTDKTWKCKKSYSSYYGKWDVGNFGGEIIDDRLRENDWNTSGYDDSKWSYAGIYNPDVLNAAIGKDNITLEINSDTHTTVTGKYENITATLSAQMVEPQAKYRTIMPIGVSKNSNGTYRIDMGENYTGYFEMNMYNGAEGDSVIFEISDKQEQMMNWKQKSKYIYSKAGKGKFTNRFNLAGGRWINVKGLKYEPKLEDIKGYVITNNRKQISSFESSSELLNKIYQINLNTYIANTIDGILVDCPHRERRSWGEVTVAAMYGDALPNFESGAYMDQYAQFVQDSQAKSGKMSAIVNGDDFYLLMWMANSPITIWETYRMLGDKRLLENHYVYLKNWMEWMYKHTDYNTGGTLKIGKRGSFEFPGLGDWCTPRGNFWSSMNSPEANHFNNCVYAYMLENAINIAEVLGKTEDAKIYADRLQLQRKVTHERSYDPLTGKYLDGRQVNQALAILAGITPEAEKQKVKAQLVDNVLYTFPYYDTGSSGQALYTRYFIEYGERMDLIYRLLKDTRHPSYGYFISKGETTWPEHWSSDASSQIHTCYTGIGGYFIKGFGGIRPNPEKLGMQNFIIKPSPVGDLTYANTSYESMYGNIVVNWKKTGTVATFHIEIPANTTAKVFIPAVSHKNVKEGNIVAENAQGIKYIGDEKNDAVGNYVVYNVVSGSYNFSVDNLPVVTIPEPMYKGDNLSLIGRVSASSMSFVNEGNLGFETYYINDNIDTTYWKAGNNNEQWIEFEWQKPQTFNKVVINEKGTNILEHKIQYWNNNAWHDILSGTSCGNNKEHNFNAVTSQKCRLYIKNSTKRVEIYELKVIKQQ
jgi:alpha-L-rhamnosidase